jgi:hypothetical protein
MAGTAPTGFQQFTKTLDAVPVHCSGWLCDSPPAPKHNQEPQWTKCEEADDERKLQEWLKGRRR